MTVQDIDIRMQSKDLASRRVAAAKASVRFIRKSAEVLGDCTKSELANRMWSVYFSLESAGLLIAPRRTKALLRSKLGIWSQVGISQAA